MMLHSYERTRGGGENPLSDTPLNEEHVEDSSAASPSGHLCGLGPEREGIR